MCVCVCGGCFCSKLTCSKCQSSNFRLVELFVEAAKSEHGKEWAVELNVISHCYCSADHDAPDNILQCRSHPLHCIAFGSRWRSKISASVGSFDNWRERKTSRPFLSLSLYSNTFNSVLNSVCLFSPFLRYLVNVRRRDLRRNLSQPKLPGTKSSSCKS